MPNAEGPRIIINVIEDPRGVATSSTREEMNDHDDKIHIRPILPSSEHWILTENHMTWGPTKGKVIHPELANIGPIVYDLADIDLWLHDGQRNGRRIKGEYVYEALKQNNSLHTCLGLRDGGAIQRGGVPLFKKFFGWKPVFLWRSVALGEDTGCYVPYVVANSFDVFLHWQRLDVLLTGSMPAARFTIL